MCPAHPGTTEDILCPSAKRTIRHDLIHLTIQEPLHGLNGRTSAPQEQRGVPSHENRTPVSTSIPGLSGARLTSRLDMSPRHFTPLSCSGRKLTGPPEGYSWRKEAQVKSWLGCIPSPDEMCQQQVMEMDDTVANGPSMTQS